MKRQWYAAPYALWMLLFTLVPLLFVAYYAFSDGQGGFTTAITLCASSVPVKTR